MPIRNIVEFPFAVLPLVVGIPRSVRFIEDALHRTLRELVDEVVALSPNLPEEAKKEAQRELSASLGWLHSRQNIH